MDDKYMNLWKKMNTLSEQITSFYVISDLLDATGEYVEALEVDKAMNSIIASKQHLEYLINKMDTTFSEVWKVVINPDEQ
jgi:hypothetical protein